MTIALEAGSHYVAMGSSFGAGPGLKPRAVGSARAAGRSSVNYAHLLAARLGLVLTDVTFSGATTTDLVTASGTGAPAQADAVTPRTRLVTITAGGNDIGYLPTLTLSSFPFPLRQLPRVRRRIAEATDPATLDRRISDLERSLVDVVGRIRAVAPDAVVVIVDYLTILPPDLSITRGKPSLAVGERGRLTASLLSATFAAAATASGSTFLPVGSMSLEHHAWAIEPWTRRFHYSLHGGAPFHPNAAGMHAVAGMVETALTSQ